MIVGIHFLHPFLCLVETDLSDGSRKSHLERTWMAKPLYRSCGRHDPEKDLPLPLPKRNLPGCGQIPVSSVTAAILPGYFFRSGETYPPWFPRPGIRGLSWTCPFSGPACHLARAASASTRSASSLRSSESNTASSEVVVVLSPNTTLPVLRILSL